MKRIQDLEARLKEMGSCLVAYSGGVDSTLLLLAARRVLGERCLAVTVKTLLHEEDEIEDARRRAAGLGVRHEIMEMKLEKEEAALRNPPERCYLCKRTIFSALREKARAEGLEVVIEASHADDLNERRPGMKALEELAVRSPLLEAGFTKEEIRAASRGLGLEGAERPSRPCLATRIPYGSTITAERLRRVSEAERFLEDRGFTAPRVRDYGHTARIELRPEELERAGDRSTREEIAKRLRDLGYTYVTLDLLGYRSGSMDEIL